MILDIGCGNLQSHNSHGAVNVDIKKSCKRISNFIQADACHLPIRPRSIDKVVCFQVIEHVENPAELLKEAKHAMREDGAIIISTPNPMHWRRIIYALRGKEVATGFNEHINCWSQHELCNLVTQAGLYPEQVWFGAPLLDKHGNEFRYTLDKFMRKLLPTQVGERHIWVKATNG